MILKKRRKKRKEGSKSKNVVLSDDEMLDLSKELHPLSHYVDDEDELVVQLFATIKQTKLQSMLPPLLKEIDLKELQSLCLHELRGMSRKRILAAINGSHMSDSSSDEYDQDRPKGPSAPQNSFLSQIPQPKGERPLRSPNDAPHQNASEDSNPDRLRTPPPPPMMRPIQNQEEGEEGAPPNNLTALDILELEMRAKLIKTMLDKQPSDEEAVENKIIIKEEDNADDILLISPSEIKQEPLTPEISMKREYNSSFNRSRSGSYCSQSESSNAGWESRSRKLRARRSRSSSHSKSSSSSRSYSRSPSEFSSCSDEKGRDVSPSLQKSSPSRKASKRKLTKKEFQERMQKAKLNRRYRKRKNSDSDSEEEDYYKSRKGKKKRKSKDFYGRASWEVKYFEKLKDELKKGDESSKKGNAAKSGENYNPQEDENNKDFEEGEYESKEEGEIESGEERKGEKELESQPIEEEEEGVCTPSDEEGEFSVKKITLKGSSDESPRRHSRRHKKRKRKISIHSRSRSKTPPLLQKIRKTKKHHSLSTAPIIEPLAAENFPKVKERNERQAWNTSKHVELIESDEEVEANSNDSKETPIPVFTKSISFSIGKKTLPVAKKNIETQEIPPESLTSSPLPSNEETKQTDQSADQKDEILPSQKNSNSLSKSTAKHEEEIRYVVPCLEIANNPKPSGPEDLDLLFTDWDELPMEEDQILNPSNEKILDKESQIKEDNDESDSTKAEQIDKLEDDKAEEPQISSTPDIEEESSQASSTVDTTEVNEPVEPSVDIIGVIEPRTDSNPEFDDELIGSSSWSSRWLQSEKVQNVVSNSKILSKVRKKIQRKGKTKIIQIIKETPEIPQIQASINAKVDDLIPEKRTSTSSANPVIGSIEEYEKLIGLKVSGMSEAEKCETKETSISVLDSDDDEDSEEEALWSKIMKK